MFKKVISILTAAVLTFGFAVHVSAEDVPFNYSDIGSGIWIDGYTGNETSLVIPETIDGKPVTIIYQIKSDTVTSVTLPKTVKYIYGAAFKDVPNLNEVRFGGLTDGLVNIGTSAFPASVEKVVLPENMTEKDIKGILITADFPENAVFYSGNEPLPHSYKLTAGTRGDGHDGEHYSICESCGYVDPDSYEEHSPQGEFYEGDHSETYHYQRCVCGYGMGTPHEWEETDGKTLTCKICNFAKNEEIPNTTTFTTEPTTSESDCTESSSESETTVTTTTAATTYRPSIPAPAVTTV
ncbi:MAG: leucine-rich repeat domain-containing protein, partial [Muribaculaceae bacterium]|nr:leucine-rich repeat domain-containing protein [Muribaculaceae bacterium]